MLPVPLIIRGVIQLQKLFKRLKFFIPPLLRGKRGARAVPRVQIMENELECLGDRKGHESYLAKKFLKKYYS